MSYKELQNEAKKLGLKYVGVSEEDLKKSIEEANSSVVEEATGGNNNPDAVVYHGKRKVRVYTFEQHGKDYAEKAKQYISHPDRDGYRVELESVETRLTCPHCGKKFRYN
jgi:hypothetical protein